jgi:hypothetical protein
MIYVQDNMSLGQLPKRLVIGCVDSDALNGTITKNPFEFKHHKINCVALNVDGRHIPAKPLQLDFENAGYIRSYMGLNKTCLFLSLSNSAYRTTLMVTFRASTK